MLTINYPGGGVVHIEAPFWFHKLWKLMISSGYPLHTPVERDHHSQERKVPLKVKWGKDVVQFSVPLSFNHYYSEIAEHYSQMARSTEE